MPYLKVPRADRAPLERLVALPAKDMQALKEALRKAEPAFLLKDLASRVAEKIKYEKSETYEVFRLLAKLYDIRAKQKVDVPTFASEVAHAAEEAGIKPESNDWATFQSDLSDLLSFEESLGITSKAAEVMNEHQRIYCSARILTDLRPVFREEVAPGPAAAVIVHNLRINFHKPQEIEQFFVSMSSSDLKELRGIIDRALKKEASLKKVAELAKLPCLDTDVH